jgi:hypothetical protein
MAYIKPKLTLLEAESVMVAIKHALHYDTLAPNHTDPLRRAIRKIDSEIPNMYRTPRHPGESQ